MKKFKLDVNIPVSIFKEGNTFVAYSPVLDLSTSADSFEKVQKRFEEAVVIFFEELVDMGTLDEILSSLGWRKLESHWTPPLQIAHTIQRMKVPLVS